MEQQLAFSAGKPGLEDDLLWNEAATATYFGQLEKARELYRQAVASANRAEEQEAAAGYEADAAVREALFGNKAAAREKAESALRLSRGPDVQYQAALALSLVSNISRALSLADDVGKRFPEDTIVQFIYLPTLHAQLDLRRNEAATAIKDLQIAPAYKLGGTLYPAYARGVAYLLAHRGNEAASEFQAILDHRGIVLNSAIGALALLQIGRALAMQGDLVKAKAAYQDFLSLWKDADANIPVLTQAKAELAKLEQQPSSRLSMKKAERRTMLTGREFAGAADLSLLKPIGPQEVASAAYRFVPALLEPFKRARRSLIATVLPFRRAS
jgi:hypothetical protein